MAALILTLTVTGKRNLGGGALMAYGTLAADTGDYATGGIAPTPTFPSIDFVSNREPDLVLFGLEDGYALAYDVSEGKIKVRVTQADGSGADLDALVEYDNSTAMAAGLGANQQWIAFWFPKVP
jgi:hypothetical protein